MDIQIPSNLERYLFERGARRGEWMAQMMDDYRHSGELRLDEDLHSRITDDFRAGWLDDQEIIQVIADAHHRHGLLLDPHSALGWAMAERLGQTGEEVVSIATAHPAKFPEAVIEALGFSPGTPSRLTDLSARPERTTVIPARLDRLLSVLETARR